MAKSVVLDNPLILFNEAYRKERLESQKLKIERVKGALLKLEAEEKKRKGLLSLVESILTSWGIEDPGKDSEACWFLTRDGKASVARELLPPNIPIITSYADLMEWEKERRKTKGVYVPIHGLGAVPPNFAVIPFAEVKRVPCPDKGCGLTHPLIEARRQTDDDMSGNDTWRLRHMVLCGDNILQVGEPNFSSHRF